MFEEERKELISEADRCQALLEKTDSVLDTIKSLENIFQYITPRTNHLHTECQTLIQERNSLKECYDKIKTNLTKQEELRSIIKRIPVIKSQILSILNNVCQSYQNSQTEQEQQPLDEYYGRFYIECRRIKELTGQLESCLPNCTSDELLLHLEEVYTVYFEIREQLMDRIFSKNLNNIITKSGRNYCELMRHSCNSLIRMIRNEIQLFNKIFQTQDVADESTGPEPNDCNLDATSESPNSSVTKSAVVSDIQLKRQTIQRFLEFLCRIFYENLRSVIIHVNHLETLAELYKMVNETLREESSEECYRSIMKSLAGDIQERMTFRVEVFIQESVLDYKPSSGDLAYPEKLEIVSSGDLKDYQAMWYPTLQRTVLALIYMKRVFDQITFKDLAQEVVIACLQSLDSAQRLIDERHGGTKMEAMLFLTKHLAILRDQLNENGLAESTKLFSDVFPKLGDDFQIRK